MNSHTLTNLEDIRTPRLDLIAITPELVRCEIEGGPGFAARFVGLAGAGIPDEWPPQDWEPHVLDFVLRQLMARPETVGWTRFVALREPEDASRERNPDPRRTPKRTPKRTLIGTVGAIPPGTEMAHATAGEIEVGYGILPAYQSRGFATEALAGMMAWVESQTAIAAFVAQTFPHLRASIRVLEKSGFALAGEGFEQGTILFRRDWVQERLDSRGG